MNGRGVARIYRALAPYRRQLFRESAAHGQPVVRHPLLHFPADPVLPTLTDDELQFMLGSELLVAPVLDKRAQRRRVWLPAGPWLHIRSGRLLGAEGHGSWQEVEAPLWSATGLLSAGIRRRRSAPHRTGGRRIALSSPADRVT